MLVIVLKATRIVSNPVVVDPNTGRRITWAYSWSTDQTYVGGHGPDAKGTGEVTNPTASKATQRNKTPWAAPGHAPSLGGGCGIFGGNPYGCPAYNDTRDPKSNAYCGQKTKRGTWAFGSSALEVDFPQGTIHELSYSLGKIPAFFIFFSDHNKNYSCFLLQPRQQSGHWGVSRRSPS